MRGKKHIFQDADWVLMVLFMGLCLLGWVNIYAASYNEEYRSIFDLSQSYGKQLMWLGTSVMLIFLIFIIDSNFFKSFSYPIYGFAILLLVGILLFGTEIKGNKSWFVIGGVISLQPSEFTKFATALVMSAFLSANSGKLQSLKIRIKALLLLALPVGLIILQPDTGSALVFASFIFVLYREGLSGNILLIGVAAVVLFIVSLLMNNTFVDFPFGITLSGKYVFMGVLVAISAAVYLLLKRIKHIWVPILIALIASVGYIYSVDYVFDNVLGDHQRNRINELLGITSDPSGAGYNVHQSKIAIGSGGFSGKGFLQGTQTKYAFVPEQNTDFIFCTIGEEWGFLGSLVVLTLFIIFLFRLVIIAERQRSRFSKIYGYCVASIFFFHFAINVGMTIGLAPVIGIPLPFFSYGGSSLWGFTILLFTFIKLDSDRKFILG